MCSICLLFNLFVNLLSHNKQQVNHFKHKLCSAEFHFKMFSIESCLFPGYVEVLFNDQTMTTSQFCLCPNILHTVS